MSASDQWLEIDSLFSAALDLPPEAREGFLERECKGRPEFAREVRELLHASDSTAGWTGRAQAALWSVMGSAIEPVPAGSGEVGDLSGQLLGSYRIVCPLARGGMGTVYLGQRADGAFQQRVAVKVLRRGLDTDDILERFRAERQIMANLGHPNIARLIDGGSTPDGRPYLVMEYVEGVPITDYCDRQRLSIDRRLRLFGTVCDAVHHAHRHGVIHRDLKPANILVDDEGHPKLLDFGIARLLDDARGTRTRTGVRLMTPSFASPEQVRGDEVGPASDIFQLGLLLYELLTGSRASGAGERESDPAPIGIRGPVEPPSSRVVHDEAAVEARGTNPAALRKRLRGDLDGITLKALRKEPERRYTNARALADDIERSLAGDPTLAGSVTRVDRLPALALRHWKVVTRAAGVAVAAALIAFALPTPGSAPGPSPAPGEVAMLPFRVSGAHPSLHYLREGMVDLLATKLTGEGGARAIPPSTVLASWRPLVDSDGADLPVDRAIGLARELGAEQVLTGEIVGTPASLIVGATVRAVPSGDVVARASVQGPADSLLSTVDGLAAQLLILGADEGVRPIGELASPSLPAIRSYLQGRVDLRAARYDDAYDRFRQALVLDSTFALTAIQAYQAAWLAPRTESDDLLDLAWRNRDRLDGRSLVYLHAVLGPDWPAPFPQSERLAGRRRLVEMAPERGDFRYMFADRIYHWHGLLDLEDGLARAAVEFRRAMELDPAYSPTYQHLIPLLFSHGNRDEAARLTRAYLRREPVGEITPFLNWRLAAEEGDVATLARIRAAMDGMSDGELLRILKMAIYTPIEVEDSDRAMSALRTRSLTPATRRRVLREDYGLQLLRGRPDAAVRVAAELREAQAGEAGYPRLEAQSALVLSALYGDGDSAAAAAAFDGLRRSALRSDDAPRPDARQPDLCTVTQWRLWHGESRGVAEAITRLRAADPRGVLKDTGRVCAILLEAIASTLRSRADAAAWTARLDSAHVTGPHALFTEVVVPASLAAARLHELRGDSVRALAAVRRRIYDFDSSHLLLASSLRTEGRLAAQVGEIEGAIRSYRHYLAMRTDVEPRLRAQVDSVRRALRALESEVVPRP